MSIPENRVSLADIAQAAGVSAATASRALSGAYGVAEATRQRVLKVAQESDYVVSPEASSLARNNTGRIAVIAPKLWHWFFGSVVAGIVDALQVAGLDTLLYQFETPSEREEFFADLPIRRKADAIIIVGWFLTDAEYERLQRMGVAVVAVGGQEVSTPLVAIDGTQAGAMAVDHLVGLGHTRIGVIAGNDSNFPYRHGVSPLARGLQASAIRHGLTLAPDLWRATEWSPVEARDAMTDLLSLSDPPTAVFCYADELAYGALHAVLRAGLVPGREVSVMGLDDQPFAAAMDLTTIRQDPRAQWVAAAELVRRLIEGGEPTAGHAPIELVERGSTSRAPH